MDTKHDLSVPADADREAEEPLQDPAEEVRVSPYGVAEIGRHIAHQREPPPLGDGREGADRLSGEGGEGEGG
jgi:hypothetical protein